MTSLDSDTPQHWLHPQTYYPRRGRFSSRQERGRELLYPRYGVAYGEEVLDLATVFGRSAPTVLEIGSGMGDTTAAMATADPERNYLAIEVHPPGVANLLWLIEENGIDNLRIYDGDAIPLLRDRMLANSVDDIHVFFPDPWPKKRHHKRRLIRLDRVAIMRELMPAGGKLHCATDWAEYADSMLEVLEAADGLDNCHSGFAPRYADRPVTKFEQRGIDSGHEIFDLEFVRCTNERSG